MACHRAEYSDSRKINSFPDSRKTNLFPDSRKINSFPDSRKINSFPDRRNFGSTQQLPPLLVHCFLIYGTPFLYPHPHTHTHTHLVPSFFLTLLPITPVPYPRLPHHAPPSPSRQTIKTIKGPQPKVLLITLLMQGRI